jgi:RsiW-degrading membrane proteinase PrsW (M82 family)
MLTARRPWLWLLTTGAVVWVVAVCVTALTRDTILIPAVILLGSFLVPVTMVVFALSRPGGSQLGAEPLLLAFAAGGGIGVVLSALVETYTLPSAYGTFVGVGVIEEVTKGAVLVAVAGLVATRSLRDGMVLGATVGAGFSAFESAGYALSAVIGHEGDHPVRRIVETEAFRALLAPFGHLTWTALLGGALFAAASARGAFRLAAGVLGTLVGIVALHAAWDASYGWAIMLTKGVMGDGWTLAFPNTQAWIGAPDGTRLVVFQAIYDALIAVWGVLGAAWVVHRWRAYQAARVPA